MNTEKKVLHDESNLFDFFKFRYYPYWPLFTIISVIFIAGAFVYLRYTPPLYESSSDILIKDEKKGTDDSKMLESLNIFTRKKIVEDEIQVLQSLSLAKEVVQNLHLYSPVFEEGHVRSVSAYTISPILIEIDNFDSLFNEPTKVFIEKAYFSFDSTQRQVIINKRSYPLNKWLATVYGNLRFIPNKRFIQTNKKPLYFSLINPKVVCTELIKKLDISETSKLSSVVKLAIRDEVPHRGEDILNELTRVYNNAGINDKNLLAANTLSFIKDRLEFVRKELDSNELQIEKYKTEHGIVDLSKQSETVFRNVGDNNQKVADANMQLAVLNEVERYVKDKDNKIGIVPSTLGVNDVGLSQLLQKLYDAEINYERMKKTVGENNPMVSSLSNEIEKIRPVILENIRIQQVSLKASLTNLNSTNDSYTSQLQSLPEKERGLLVITRQEAIMNNVYSFLLQKREETALSYASTVPDSRTVDVAVSTMDPVSPKKIIILAIACIAASGLWILIITLKDFLNNKILFRKDIERLTNLPVVGELSNFAMDDDVFILHQNGNQVVKEEFRQLRAAIGLQVKNSSRKKLLFTSGGGGEGKSFISANMALSLAMAGKKVVLIDLDQKNPEITTILDLSNEAGVTDFLQGDREPYEIIKSSFCENLFVCGYGKPSLNFSDFFFNKRLDELFEYLEESFDFVIVDGPSFESVSDAYVLNECCDLTAFVARHDYTQKTVISLLEERNNARSLKNIKIIFNGIKSRGMLTERFGIGYGYGYEKFSKQRTRTKNKAEVLAG